MTAQENFPAPGSLDATTIDSAHGALDQTSVENLLHATLGSVVTDLSQDFHNNRTNYMTRDLELKQRLDATTRRHEDDSIDTNPFELALAEAVYQGASRTQMQQLAQQGHQPFTDRLLESDKVSRPVKTLISGFTNNKANYYASLPQQEPAASQVQEAAHNNRQVFNTLASWMSRPDISDHDRGALGLGLVYALAASAEAWNQQSVAQSIAGDIAHALVV